MENRADYNCFSSASEVFNSLPYELSNTYSYCGIPGRWCVFQSKQGNELQSILGPLYVGSITFTSRNEAITKKIQVFLQNLRFITDYFFIDTFVQFWSPARIAGEICLATADQPFAVGRLHKGLFSYRKHCLENIIFIDPADGDELSGEERYLSSPEWVFRHGLPEYFDFGNESDSLQWDFALNLGLNRYAALPLFEYGKQDCIGVFEILSKLPLRFLEDFGALYSSKLKEMNMRFGIGSTYDGNIRAYGNRFKYSRKLVAYALPLMQDISDKHQLPLVQMWFAPPNESCISRLLGVWKKNIGYELKGIEVVERALSRSACFCKSRIYGSENYGSFAICLKSTKGDQFYILEFLFPCTGIDDPRTFVTKLVEDLKIQIGKSKSSPFENLDETLLVDVVKSSDDLEKLDFFEICTTSSSHLVSKHLEGSKTMRHDSLQPHVGGTFDEMRSGTIEKIVPPGLIQRPELQHPRGMIQDETPREAIIEPNTLTNEENIVTGVQCERNKAERNTLDVQYGITRQVLQQCQGMKLQDAANKLGVSRSTLKRICKKHGIKRWHHQGSRKTSSHQDAFNPPNENTDAHSSIKTTATQDGNSIIVKATYGECIWKFQLLHSAKKIDLEQQLVECLNLPMGSFKIRYLDEENDWISVSRDADLKLCIDTCRSQGKTTIKMLVN